MDEAVTRRRGGQIDARGVEGEQMARRRVAADRNRAGQPGESENETLHLASLARRDRARYKST
ncbi:MAG: hypothetical protein ABSC26_12960 [Stellaceae bacterium]